MLINKIYFKHTFACCIIILTQEKEGFIVGEKSTTLELIKLLEQIKALGKD